MRSPIVAAIATAAVSALLVVTGCALAFGQGSNGANPAGSSTQCAISPVLVNSCRAWLGAAAAGNPGAPPDSVSQFTYLEKLVGHSMDVYRDYDNCGPTGCTTGTVPLAAGSAELHFALRANTYVDINWKPATTWSQVDGSDPAVAADTYPCLKTYLVFADTGNNSGPGCLTDYDTNGQHDPAKQAAFNQLANTIPRGGYGPAAVANH